MIIHTASEGISLARKLETDSAAFYEAGARAYPELYQALLTFARENQKNIKQIEQTYYSVITDAIEGCFALDLETDKYVPDTNLKGNAGLAGCIKQALQIEEIITQFYLDAGEQLKSLMTEVSRSFTLTAKKRKTRLIQLSEFMTT
jgi:hypothetical protein